MIEDIEDPCSLRQKQQELFDSIRHNIIHIKMQHDELIQSIRHYYEYSPITLLIGVDEKNEIFNMIMGELMKFYKIEYK
jgi:hypothetical protein